MACVGTTVPPLWSIADRHDNLPSSSVCSDNSHLSLTRAFLRYTARSAAVAKFMSGECLRRILTALPAILADQISGECSTYRVQCRCRLGVGGET